MKLIQRAYRDEEDYWRIRGFLREIFLLNGRREKSWDLLRFDYWRWHINANLTQFRLQDVVFIWETVSGQIAAVANPDNRGESFFQVHPGFRSPELEEELVLLAEKQFFAQDQDGRRKLTLWADQHDDLRHEIFQRRGYHKNGWAECQRRRSLDLPIQESTLAPGYTVRALRDGAELLERCYASGLAFHPDDIAIAIDNRKDVTWYLHIQNIPIYRRDLDLVAVAPDGAVAAFATVWFDDVTRCGVFEPVGTVPDHQRRGLGKAVMLEGLRRLKKLGATLACVSSYSEAAGALYASVGFTEYDLNEPWVKEF